MQNLVLGPMVGVDPNPNPYNIYSKVSVVYPSVWSHI